ncbi:ADP-ribose pyrophosphatase YjhB, NUDIX family [Blastococcus aggregatus]|uniref:ADP-ribose pyrophosphatase YjhB, NUDIX family n=1 Tax=Blastococcus aggregatus TaxID=38502 RepID=A0A285UWX8_9ACTN|nr:NUDIX hydrolase [Blastococcus aggregatus]SOC46187.1 ADP-ribose pyrophosphatase YjhB, NUDIX family [Blastococcus aggregatus]
MTEHPSWTTLSSRYVVNDEWLTLRADTVRTGEGHVLDPFYVAEHRDWVNCVVVDEDEHAVLVRQYRHGVGKHVLELVAGGVEPGETPEDAVRRELLEETGYTGGALFRTGVSYANPASQTNRVFSFLAVGGACRERQALEPGESLSVERAPLREVARDLVGGTGEREVLQSLHLASALLALAFVASSAHPAVASLRTSLTSS